MYVADATMTSHTCFHLAVFCALLSLAPAAQAYQHPSLGRFMQRDPGGYVDSMSLYRTGARNPVVERDPFGLQSTQPATSPTSLPCCICAVEPDKCWFEIRRVSVGNNPILNWYRDYKKAEFYNAGIFEFGRDGKDGFTFNAQPGTVVVTLKHPTEKTGGCHIVQDVLIREQSDGVQVDGKPKVTRDDAKNGKHDYDGTQTQIDPDGNAFIDDSPRTGTKRNLIHFDFEATDWVLEVGAGKPPIGMWGYWVRYSMEDLNKEWQAQDLQDWHWGFWPEQ